MIDRATGAPLTDARRSAAGVLLPIGGYKGAGLAMVLGLLAGTLNGAGVGRDVVDFNADDTTAANTGHFILALDVNRFIDPRLFAAGVVAHCEELRASGRLPGVDGIRLPGDERARRRATRVRDGIPIPPALSDHSHQPGHAPGYREPRMTLPAAWPQGRSLAVSVSVMLEGWSDGAAPGVGPMGNMLRAGTLDLQGRSWAEYGVNAGAWRLLEVLAAARVRAVFYISGILAERHPDLVRAIAAAGHNVAAHGWAQEIIPATQDPATEAQDIARCVTALMAATGTRPAGVDQPPLHTQRRHHGVAGRGRAALAQRLLRPRFAARDPNRVRPHHRRAVHDGGERHAHERAVWAGAGGIHADGGADPRWLGHAAAPPGLPRPHGPCACVWAADGGDGVRPVPGRWCRAAGRRGSRIMTRWGRCSPEGSHRAISPTRLPVADAAIVATSHDWLTRSPREGDDRARHDRPEPLKPRLVVPNRSCHPPPGSETRHGRTGAERAVGSGPGGGPDLSDPGPSCRADCGDRADGRRPDLLPQLRCRSADRCHAVRLWHPDRGRRWRNHRAGAAAAGGGGDHAHRHRRSEWPHRRDRAGADNRGAAHAAVAVSLDSRRVSASRSASSCWSCPA